MPSFRKGNMLLHLDECDVACITTNSFVKNNGCLVMGAGIAKQVRNKWPGIDEEFGRLILEKDCHMGVYGLLASEKYPFMAFQVKTFWGQEAEVHLIKKSCEALKALASAYPHKTYFLNFPGIGNGRLLRSNVLPFLMDLPENVIVWEFR